MVGAGEGAAARADAGESAGAGSGAGAVPGGGTILIGVGRGAGAGTGAEAGGKMNTYSGVGTELALPAPDVRGVELVVSAAGARLYRGSISPSPS